MPSRSHQDASEHREAAVLPLRNQLVFPGCREEIQVARPQSLALLRSLDLAATPIIAVFLQRDVGTETPGHADMHEIGVAVRVHELQTHGELGCTVLVEGMQRVRRLHTVDDRPFLMATMTMLDDGGRNIDGDAEADHVDVELLRSLAAEALPALTTELQDSRPGQLADRVAARIPATLERRAEVLAAQDPATRVTLVLAMVREQLKKQITLRHLDLPTIESMQQLWVLQEGAPERIDREVSRGAMTADEGARLMGFREQGYVVWEGLIGEAAIDALLEDIRGIANHPGRYVITDHRRQRAYRASGSDFDQFENILDTHVNLESARRVCFHPTLLRFLELIFQERPLATQQLLFQRSNIHPMHQDTAFVCMREPLLMVASWVALEDVVRGRGELTYYEGSHLLPHQRFADGSKRCHPGIDDEDAARDALLRNTREMGCRKRDFIASKGDVLLWAADLVHGSNPRTQPAEETRLSAVTHYCPESNEPLYSLQGTGHRRRQPYGERALIASSHYRLPTTECPAVPIFPLPEPC